MGKATSKAECCRRRESEAFEKLHLCQHHGGIAAEDVCGPVAQPRARRPGDMVLSNVPPEAVPGRRVRDAVELEESVQLRGCRRTVALAALRLRAAAQVPKLCGLALAPEHRVEEADGQLILADQPNEAHALNGVQSDPKLRGARGRPIARIARDHPSLARAHALRVPLHLLQAHCEDIPAGLRGHVGVLREAARRNSLPERLEAVMPSVEVAGHQPLLRLPEHSHDVLGLRLGYSPQPLADQRRVAGLQERHPAQAAVRNRAGHVERGLHHGEAGAQQAGARGVDDCRHEVPAILRDVQVNHGPQGRLVRPVASLAHGTGGARTRGLDEAALLHRTSAPPQPGDCDECGQGGPTNHAAQMGTVSEAGLANFGDTARVLESK
mmetsp:Transcript_45940/g.137283  ORF Transcript_45940/g.137283 Transcript_45940/m.137283 type:complete len:382 (+) Transcript_45940:559-1704(+)